MTRDIMIVTFFDAINNIDNRVRKVFNFVRNRVNQYTLEHSIAVATLTSININQYKKFNPNIVSLQIIALAHDLLEYSDITVDDLRKTKLFKEDELNSIVSLTNTFDTYEEFIANMQNDINACIVKIYDIEDNLDLLYDNQVNIEDSFYEERKRAYNFLKGKLNNI